MLFSDMDEKIESVAAYRVLARKYRPTSFDALIGQEVLVRTLTNAIESGRIAQAYMLTGVRGIGKTTTARIIARALNCIGADGKGGPTINPCGVCPNCEAIAADRHVDVIEMDAASRTGVDDIRDIIDGVRYGPVSARYKIYIIDEVHMLSKNAFNALLKTLEEPPPHTKFIFATTEIRKVPVTVLSRCQRFDLRRVDSAMLAKHFRNVCNWEKAEADDEALTMIAAAADGSVRDGLSLLDQAISRSEGKVSAEDVRTMLGLADRARVINLFEALHQGEPAKALALAEDMRAMGADALMVLQDLADIAHMLSRTKAAPELVEDKSLPELERHLARRLGSQLPVPVLARTWQMLLKGMQEVQYASDAHKALEMVLIRMIYAADMPTPDDLIRKLQDSGALSGTKPSPSGGGAGNGGGNGSARLMQAGGSMGNVALAVATSQPAAHIQTAPMAALAELPMPETFRELAKLFEEKREVGLYTHLYRDVYLVNFQPGLLELRVKEYTPANLAARVMGFLQEWTGKRWVVTLSQEQGAQSLAEQDDAVRAARWKNAENHPLVQAVLQKFDGAKLIDVRGKPVHTETAGGKDAAGDDITFDDES
jgi:DNA polymerase-3 subunit gamma/tau